MKYLDDDIQKRIKQAKENNKQLSDIKWIKTPELFNNRIHGISNISHPC